MTVADLQQHLAELRRLLETAGVKGTILADLAAIQTGLQPFRERSLREFSDFLIRAEAYRANGEVPIKAPSKGKSDKPKSTAGKVKSPAGDATVMVREIQQLYDQVISPAVTADMIDAAVQRLGNLTKDGVVAVAAAIDLKLPKSASKAKVVGAIKQRLVDRKGSFQRAGLLDRQTSSSQSSDGAADSTIEKPALSS